MKQVGWCAIAGLVACGSEIPPPEMPPPPPVDVAAPTTEPAPPSLQVAADEPAVSYRCAGGSLFVAADRPYCVQSQATSFVESKRWCDDNGGRLLVLESDAQSAALQATFAPPNAIGDRAWIGLVQLRSGEWRWSTLAPVRFASWSPGEPNDVGGEDCGEIYPASGQWNDLACDTALPFVCEARGRKGAPGKLACVGHSFQVGTTTYCVDPSRRASWGDAENACKKQGGTLATFENEGEMRAFHAVTRSPGGTDRIWLGLTDEGHEGKFRTAGHPHPGGDARGRGVDFQRWRAGEPNNVGPNGEHCVEWFASDAGWNDVPCDLAHVGVCVPP
jgi:hypothetical protein